MYTLMLATHLSCVLLSITFFAVRGYWMVTDNVLLQHRLVRILPHVIDTLLLASAISLTILLRQYPFVHDWLTVKVIALVVYILLGTIALHRGKDKRQRILALIAAMVVFGFIVSVAHYHNPLGFLVHLG
jgi:uncharacterized membrane protein SirB2